MGQADSCSNWSLCPPALAEELTVTQGHCCPQWGNVWGVRGALGVRHVWGNMLSGDCWEAVSGYLLLTRLVVWRDRLPYVMKEGQTWVPAGLAFSGQCGGETRPPRGLHLVGKASRPQWVLLCLRPVLGAEGTGMTPTLADEASDSGYNVCFRDSLWGEDVLPALPRDPHPASRRRSPDLTPARVPRSASL